jgi:hypothetical protein
MTDRNATIICLAADKTAAEALASQYPGGAGSFGPGARALTVNPTGAAPATHFAVSGQMDADMVEAFETSVLPIFMVLPLDDTNFFAQIASREPQLFTVVETEEA